jgi:hypothetical protein
MLAKDSGGFREWSEQTASAKLGGENASQTGSLSSNGPMSRDSSRVKTLSRIDSYSGLTPTITMSDLFLLFPCPEGLFAFVWRC